MTKSGMYVRVRARGLNYDFRLYALFGARNRSKDGFQFGRHSESGPRPFSSARALIFPLELVDRELRAPFLSAVRH